MARLRLGAAAVSGIVAFALHAAGALDTLEWKTWDWRVRHLTDVHAPDDVALLLIDQASLQFLQEEESIPWPWPRALYVPVVQYLRQCGARGIVFDILFTE
ncbi:CHASE2 domain-containing protein, partial [bacterium]|nr:CHASE2 domain-containing protein [bacterium]